MVRLVRPLGLLLLVGCATVGKPPGPGGDDDDDGDGADPGGSLGVGGSNAGGAVSFGGSLDGGAGNLSGAPAQAGKSSSTAGAAGSTGKAGSGSGGTTSSAGSGGTGGTATSAGTSSGGTAAGQAGYSPGGSSGSVLFEDDFEKGSMGWTPNIAGETAWSIVLDQTGTNNVYEEALGTNVFRAASNGQSTWTDQVIEARVKVVRFVAQSTSYLVGVYGRYRDANNHYYIALRYDNRFVLRARKNGSDANLGNAVDVTLTVGQWYNVKLDMRGPTIMACFEQTCVTATDTAIPSGGVAVGTRNATAQFDDIRVTVP